jgi:hypothetical protein
LRFWALRPQLKRVALAGANNLPSLANLVEVTLPPY